MSRPLCPVDNSKMKFSHRIQSDRDIIIRRYRCEICGAELSILPRLAFLENMNIRQGKKEGSGKVPPINYKFQNA